MASITINPTSNSFRSDGGSGTIGVNVETADWSSTPSDDAVWMAVRERTNLVWSDWSIIKIKGEDGEDGSDGDDGRGIMTATTTYKKGTNATTPPTGTWSSTPVAANAGEYLWTRTIFTYTDGTTSDPAYSVARWGEDGDSGTATKSPTLVYSGYYHKDPHSGETDTSISYFGNPDLVSVVYHNGQYYKANSTAASEYGSSNGMFRDSSSSPASSPYWTNFGASFDSIATGVVFAEQAYLDNAVVRILETANLNNGGYIVAENNSLTMYDYNGKQKLLVTGDDLGDLSESVSHKQFTGGTMYGTSYYINQTQDLLTASNFNISSVDNTVELPSITVDVFKGANSDTLNASASLLIDDVVVASSPTFNGEPIGRHIYLTIPSRNINLSTGSHTLKIQAQASSTNGTLSSISYPGSSTAGTVDISYNAEKVQIGANGFRAAFGASNYAEFVDNGSPEFILRAGSYILKVSSSGIQASSNGGSSWRTL